MDRGTETTPLSLLLPGLSRLYRLLPEIRPGVLKEAVGINSAGLTGSNTTGATLFMN